VAHGVGYGLFVGALGMAASAGSNLLAPLYMIAEPAAVSIPAGRFSGLLVQTVAGVRLARGR
jgi:hypothetical protein